MFCKKTPEQSDEMSEACGTLMASSHRVLNANPERMRQRIRPRLRWLDTSLAGVLFIPRLTRSPVVEPCSRGLARGAVKCMDNGNTAQLRTADSVDPRACRLSRQASPDARRQTTDGSPRWMARSRPDAATIAVNPRKNLVAQGSFGSQPATPAGSR